MYKEKRKEDNVLEKKRGLRTWKLNKKKLRKRKKKRNSLI